MVFIKLDFRYFPEQLEFKEVIMIHKIIEWDKRRKFGHRFGDFIFLLFCVFIINTIVFCITQKINIFVLVLSMVVYEILVSRDTPDDMY